MTYQKKYSADLVLKFQGIMFFCICSSISVYLSIPHAAGSSVKWAMSNVLYFFKINFVLLQLILLICFISSILEQVGRMTLGGLLALGYTVVVSYKRASTSVSNGHLSMSFETIDSLGETFMVLRGTDRKVRTYWSC